MSIVQIASRGMGQVGLKQLASVPASLCVVRHMSLGPLVQDDRFVMHTSQNITSADKARVLPNVTSILRELAKQCVENTMMIDVEASDFVVELARRSRESNFNLGPVAHSYALAWTKMAEFEDLYQKALSENQMTPGNAIWASIHTGLGRSKGNQLRDLASKVSASDNEDLVGLSRSTEAAHIISSGKFATYTEGLAELNSDTYTSLFSQLRDEATKCRVVQERTEVVDFLLRFPTGEHNDLAKELLAGNAELIADTIRKSPVTAEVGPLVSIVQYYGELSHYNALVLEAHKAGLEKIREAMAEVRFSLARRNKEPLIHCLKEWQVDPSATYIKLNRDFAKLEGEAKLDGVAFRERYGFGGNRSAAEMRKAWKQRRQRKREGRPPLSVLPKEPFSPATISRETIDPSYTLPEDVRQEIVLKRTGEKAQSAE